MDMSSPPGTSANDPEPKLQPKQEIKDMALANDDVALAATLLVSLLDNPLPTGTSSNLQRPSDFQADEDAAAAACVEGLAAGSQSEDQRQTDLDADGGAVAVASTCEKPAERQGEENATLQARISQLEGSPPLEDVFDDAEARVSMASMELTEVRQRPKQPESQYEASTQIQEDIFLFLEVCTIFKKTDFDGRVRQYLHALRTIGGRKCVHEALDNVRDSVEGFDRKQIQKPSAYLLSSLKRYLRAIKCMTPTREPEVAKTTTLLQ